MKITHTSDFHLNESRVPNHPTVESDLLYPIDKRQDRKFISYFHDHNWIFRFFFRQNLRLLSWYPFSSCFSSSVRFLRACHSLTTTEVTFFHSSIKSIGSSSRHMPKYVWRSFTILFMRLCIFEDIFDRITSEGVPAVGGLKQSISKMFFEKWASWGMRQMRDMPVRGCSSWGMCPLGANV